MSFQAIDIILENLEAWQLVSAAFVGIVAGLSTKGDKSIGDRIFQSTAIFCFTLMAFGIFAVIQAQSSGDHLPFAALLPSTLLLGFFVSALFLAGIWITERKVTPFSLIVVPIGMVFFALFFLLVFYVFPRVIGLNSSTSALFS